MRVRSMLATLGILALTAFADVTSAGAQTTDVRFVLDFLLQGQQSPFVLGRERGYYMAQRSIFIAFDPGRGGADSITKVASGTHDIGFGDLSALIEFNAKNPDRELIAVALIYERAPLSFISLKKAGITKPADLAGRKGAAPAVDATYRLFDVFAESTRLIRRRAVDQRPATGARSPAGARRSRLYRSLGDDGGSVSHGARREARGPQRDDAARSRPRSLCQRGVHHPGVCQAAPECGARVRQGDAAVLAGSERPSRIPQSLRSRRPSRFPTRPSNSFALTRRLSSSSRRGVRKAGIGNVDPARLSKHIDIVTDGFQLPRKLPPDQVFRFELFCRQLLSAKSPSNSGPPGEWAAKGHNELRRSRSRLAALRRRWRRHARSHKTTPPVSQRRVRRRRRALGLRQVDPDEGRDRTVAGDRRQVVVSGRDGHRAAQHRRHGVPEPDAAAVAHDARQRHAAAGDRRTALLAAQARARRLRGEGARPTGARRPQGLRGALSLAALRRHAAARLALPGADP